MSVFKVKRFLTKVKVTLFIYFPSRPGVACRGELLNCPAKTTYGIHKPLSFLT